MSASVLASIDSIGPQLRAAAESNERSRSLQPEIVAAMSSLDLFRLYVPRCYDGPEVDPPDVIEALAAIASHDGAAGWCAMIASTTASMGNRMVPSTARAVFGPRASITGGAFAPNGTTVPVDGGYRLTGRWSWGSGTDHCTHITAGAMVGDGELRMMTMPAGEVELIDTWDSMGLKGTASGDFAVHDVFVPEEYTMPILTARPTNDSPLARMPLFSLLGSGVAATLIGIAERAVQEFALMAQQRVPAQSRKRVAEWSTSQAELGRATAAVRAAKAYLLDEVGSAWQTVRAGGRVEHTTRASIRLACSHAASEACRAVDLAFVAGGGGAVFSSSAIQRCYRDVHTGAAHLMVAPRMFEVWGRIAMGIDVDLTMM